MSYRLLLVQPDRDEAASARRILVPAGYTVDSALTFEEGVRSVTADPPDVLIAALRLERFNGVHLVLRTRSVQPTVACAVTGIPGDRSSDIEALEIPYVDAPVTKAGLLTAVARLIDGRPPRSASIQRRWPRKRAFLPATISDAAVEVVDLSYGGLRLRGVACRAGIGKPMDIEFPTLGLSIVATPRWTNSGQSEDGISWCGAELLYAGSDGGERWRGVVDSLK
jgi:DNA-binding response OmpR family regulator